MRITRREWLKGGVAASAGYLASKAEGVIPQKEELIEFYPGPKLPSELTTLFAFSNRAETDWDPRNLNVEDIGNIKAGNQIIFTSGRMNLFLDSEQPRMMLSPDGDVLAFEASPGTNQWGVSVASGEPDLYIVRTSGPQVEIRREKLSSRSQWVMGKKGEVYLARPDIDRGAYEDIDVAVIKSNFGLQMPAEPLLCYANNRWFCDGNPKGFIFHEYFEEKNQNIRVRMAYNPALAAVEQDRLIYDVAVLFLNNGVTLEAVAFHQGSRNSKIPFSVAIVTAADLPELGFNPKVSLEQIRDYKLRLADMTTNGQGNLGVIIKVIRPDGTKVHLHRTFDSSFSLPSF